ncbi:hypothetical protein A6A04_00610 [Paramagnetospirillum marisnigri]|uniref:histidine kinase n=1 Tax=Paramagnetospirillum marisnigri TaxID=1285242 RepID=A0A178MSK0_9PROT|nr:response regulator [Paramagnetospirillum marisnigri]OAN52232.1 hypothetical protein A6A04_00610 [Paramagnetospirillum marisnigri]
MQARQTKIVTRLIAGFAVVLMLTVVMAALAVRTMGTMAELASDMYAHPFTVTNALVQLRASVNGIRADMLGLLRAQSPAEIEQIVGMVAAADFDIETNIDVIRRQYLGRPEDVRQLGEEMARWRESRNHVISLVRQGRIDLATAGLGEVSRPLYLGLRDNLDTIYLFALNKAAEFNTRIEQERQAAIRQILLTLAGLLALGFITARVITRSIVGPLQHLRECMAELADGNLDVTISNQTGRGELAAMARAVEVFKGAAQRLYRQRWIKAEIAQLSADLQPAESPLQFGQAALERLAPALGAVQALFHLRRENEPVFDAVAAWGHSGQVPPFRAGDGLAGQAVLSKSLISRDGLPSDYLRVRSGLGEALPRLVLAVPVIMRGHVLAVIELATLAPLDEGQRGLLDESLPILGLNLEILERNRRTRDLLAQTQVQAEELRSSEEELRSQSEALQSANEELRASEEELRMQQEALQAANEELRLKGEALEERGEALETARAEADRRAVELDQASRYKSEFLANMSHELRTPLNSLLILSKSLADNDQGNLTEDQVESARVVHESGSTLLSLINEILDLSKIEAGKMSLNLGDIPSDSLIGMIRRRFLPVAQDKGLSLTIEEEAGLPAIWRGDRGKIEQVVNNLVGNALKFTTKGGVTVRLSSATTAERTAAGCAGGGQGALALTVKDSGIGITEADLARVFRAFEQVDGSSSRQFGGTGLGLTISRQLARLMGGDVLAASTPGLGSTFTLVIPLEGATAASAAEPEPTPRPIEPPASAAATGGTPLLLVVEDDATFRNIVCDLAQKRGFRTLAAANGGEGVALARQHLPSGIILDIGLPDLDGWGVIETLRQSPETAAIPVHVISAADEKLRASQAGAIGFLAKPAPKERIEAAFDQLLRARPSGQRRVLLADADSEAADAVMRILGGLGLDILACGNGAAALALLRNHRFDCLILDPSLPDMSGAELLEQAARDRIELPAVIVHSASDLSAEDTMRIREFTDSIVIQGARSPDRLLDEVSLFLHSVEARLGRDKTIAAAPPCAPARMDLLPGTTVLVVDDDMRNAFALSKVLRAKGLKALIAQDGAKALAHLDSQERIDVVLMDIMMPGMDGYQTMHEIRKRPRFAHLPIIALTAKAMAGDRANCLDAGANDYMAKPVDVDRLLVMMAARLKEAADARPRE